MTDIVERLRKMARAIYIAADEQVANDISDGLTKAADEITQLRERIAALEAQRNDMVPIHADGKYVFLDGPGDVELDHGGKLRARADAAEAEIERLRAALNRYAHGYCGEDTARAALRYEADRKEGMP